MSSKFSLHIEKHIFSADEIRTQPAAAHLTGYQDLTAYGKSTLSFCHDWMQGRKDYEQQTSGSTGKPKVIRLTRTQMQVSAAMTARALRLQAGYRALVCLSTDYIAGKMMLVRAMEVEMQAHVVPPSSQPLTGLEKIDFIALVPLQLSSMLDENVQQNLDKLNSMRAILLGGAPLSLSLEEKIRQHISVPVYHSYGMTETVSHIALRKINGKAAADTYKLLPGIEAKQDKRGCLMVKGAVTEGRWLITNDLIEMISAESFRWLGRADFVINSGGVKLQLDQLERKIEKLLGEQGLFFSFLVSGLPDEKLGQKLIMLVEEAPDNVQDSDSLRRILKPHLSTYELPREVISVRHFVRTPSGKIDRQATLRLIND
ncbi:MAG: AMP-binding protein [bacterium]